MYRIIPIILNGPPRSGKDTFQDILTKTATKYNNIIKMRDSEYHTTPLAHYKITIDTMSIIDPYRKLLEDGLCSIGKSTEEKDAAYRQTLYSMKKVLLDEYREYNMPASILFNKMMKNYFRVISDAVSDHNTAFRLLFDTVMDEIKYKNDGSVLPDYLTTVDEIVNDEIIPNFFTNIGDIILIGDDGLSYMYGREHIHLFITHMRSPDDIIAFKTLCNQYDFIDPITIYIYRDDDVHYDTPDDTVASHKYIGDNYDIIINSMVNDYDKYKAYLNDEMESILLHHILDPENYPDESKKIEISDSGEPPKEVDNIPKQTNLDSLGLPNLNLPYPVVHCKVPRKETD